MTDNVTPDNQSAAQEVSVQTTMIEHLRKLLDADLQDSAVVQHQIVLRIPASSIQQVLAALRDDKYAAFNQLSDLTAVDYPERPERFELVYQLLSMRNNMRLRLLAAVGEGRPFPRRRQSTVPPTGPSARYGTCSASSSPATPTCAAC